MRQQLVGYRGAGQTGSTVADILKELDSIIATANQLEQEFAGELAAVDPRFRDGATNLIHYVALRRFDLRPLQAQLAVRGLSSLGRAERHVMASLRAVRHALDLLARRDAGETRPALEDFSSSKQQLESHAADVLGPKRPERTSRIMVTLPTQAATDPDLVRQLIESGMDVARINCAHDNEQTWSAMIRHVRHASAVANSQCKVFMDLAGPKLRTGVLAPGPKVARLRPRRDARGQVISPKRLWLASGEREPRHNGTVIPVSEGALLARRGDCFKFRDTRGKKRELNVIEVNKHSVRVECHKPAFVETGTRLRLRRQGKVTLATLTVGELPAVEQPILLKKHDRLILHRGVTPGEPATLNTGGKVIEPAHIACTLPEVFRDVRAGEPVFINDGKIGGVAQSVCADEMDIEIMRASRLGSRLRGDRSINFPASNLRIRGLTDKDRQDLRFITQHADAVGLSFVRQVADVYELQRELEQNDSANPAIVLKIETVRGFKNLVRLLLTAMRRYPAGVMIARGDLAVECGWERLAELQEEILWLCEAARVPVIWATQVLESETKKGLPSRAEISDAAMSQRADCVMLNKGPHVIEAMRMLDNILHRMQAHQSKKSATLRRLSIAGTSH